MLGTDAEKTIADAVARGLLAVTERKSLSFHPLLRQLLIRRFGEADAKTRKTLLTQCRRLFTSRRWDEALCVAEASQDADFVTEAIEAALDDLLAAGRTNSLQRWVTAARATGAEGGLIDYAESEALLRGGEFDHALAKSSLATSSLDGDLAARARLVSARAAHLNDRHQLTSAYANSAAALAITATTREDALWLRFLASIGDQEPDLPQRLEDFKAEAVPGVRQALLSASGELILGEIQGGLLAALDTARGALALARDGEDPIAHTALLSSYSYALAIVSRYEESLLSAERLAAVAEGCGIDFPIRYAQIYRAGAYIGQRRFALADRTLAALQRQTQDEPRGYFRGSIPVQRARLYASLGNIQRAQDALSLGPDEHCSRAARGAFTGWQTLLEAIEGSLDDAAQIAETSQEAARSIDATALFYLAQAVVELRGGDLNNADSSLDAAIETEALDPVLIGVRAEPRLAERLAQRHDTKAWLQRLLARTADASLAKSLGLRVPRTASQKQKLTPREAEVHELIAQGLTNEEIAKVLYISLSTTKVHAKHIFEKLGVHSRIEAARALRNDV